MLLRLLVATMLLAACGSPDSEVDQDKSGGGFKDTDSLYEGLAFTSVDRAYSSSTLWFNTFATGELKALSTGETGDPWLAVLGGKLRLFNRSSGKLNLRTFDPINETKGDQLELDAEVFGAGDPHAAYELSPTRVLMALNVAGKLVVLNPDTGQVTQQITGDFDTGDGPFRPEAISWGHASSKGNVYFVVHQGLGADFKTPTGKSQIFLFEDDGSTVTVMDLDTGTDKIQGIPLKSTNPVAMYNYKSSKQAAVVGLCMPWIEGDCVQTIETINAEARTASVVYDFTASGYVGNGGVVGGTDGAFYAAVTQGSDLQVVKVAPEQESIAPVHKFPAGSAGCCALYFDDSTAALYVGDFPTDGEDGTLTRYGADGTAGTVTVEGNPYSGLLLDQ